MADYSSQLKKIKIPSGEGDLESQGNEVVLEQRSIPKKTESNSVLRSMFSKVKGYVKLSTSENGESQNEQNTPCLKKISSFCEIERSYTAFFIFLFIGLGLIFLSFLFLPMVLLSPQKFVSLFSLGNITTISSFIFYYGTYEFLSLLFNKDRRWYTVAFLISIFIGIYFSFFAKTYWIFSLMCSSLQLFVMIMFSLSFIPGGRAGISVMLNMITAPFRKIFKK